MSGKYAKGTVVTVEQSRRELEGILNRWGATKTMIASDNETGRVAVACFLRERHLSFIIEAPRRDDFGEDTAGRARNAAQQERAWAQAHRERWRSFLLYIKATMEAVECGFMGFDEAFMPHILLPNNQTAARQFSGQIEAAYANGTMPTLCLEMKE